ncbi:MAG: glycosyltransferase family 9 protein [Gammaproteobacteria bacterium]
MSEPVGLFVTLSNIGDAVMTTPALEALHGHQPHLRFDIVADARSAELFEPCPYRRDLHLFDKRGGVRDHLRLLRTLRRTRYECIVDLRTDGLCWLLRGRRRLGKRRPVPGRHAVLQHLDAVAPLTGTQVPPPALWIDPARIAPARARMQARAGERVLALGPGANWPGKIWPVERFAALVEVLADAFDRVVLLGNGADRERAGALAARLALPAANLAGATDLGTAAAVLAASQAFVGNDSGLGHIAAAAGIPTLAVFGPGDPDRYRPWGPSADWIGSADRQIASVPVAAVAQRLRALCAAG